MVSKKVPAGVVASAVITRVEALKEIPCRFVGDIVNVIEPVPPVLLNATDD